MTLAELGFLTDAGEQGRRYRFALTVLDGGHAYVASAVGNLDRDAREDVLFAARGAGYTGAVVVAHDDVTGLDRPARICGRGRDICFTL